MSHKLRQKQTQECPGRRYVYLLAVSVVLMRDEGESKCLSFSGNQNLSESDFLGMKETSIKNTPSGDNKVK